MSDMEFFEDIDGIEAAQQTQNILFDTQERIGMVLDLLPMGLFIHQPMGILFANQQACRTLKKQPDELYGQHILDYFSDKNLKPMNDLMDAAFQSQKPQIIEELDFYDEQGELSIIRIIASSLPWDGTPVIQILIQDITAQKSNERELIRLSETDPLTEAYNRRKFIEMSHKMIARQTAEAGPSLQLIVFDIDFFKKVNDDMGHEAGDIALKEVVKVIHNSLRRHNLKQEPENHAILARMGGEEFAILAPNTSYKEAKMLAGFMRMNIEKMTINTFSFSFHVTISMGLTHWLDGDNSIDSLLRRADLALYTAKEDGRNCIKSLLENKPSELSDPMLSRQKRRPE